MIVSTDRGLARCCKSNKNDKYLKLPTSCLYLPWEIKVPSLYVLSRRKVRQFLPEMERKPCV